MCVILYYNFAFSTYLLFISLPRFLYIINVPGLVWFLFVNLQFVPGNLQIFGRSKANNNFIWIEDINICQLTNAYALFRLE